MFKYLVLLFLFAACQIPSAPTAILPPEPKIQWSLVASGCDPRLPLPTPSGPATYSKEDGILTITHVREDDLLTGEFRLEDNNWKLCDWDTSDN